MSTEVMEGNARIRSTMLGVEDHGVFTFMLDLDFGGSGQGAGGYVLDEYKKELKRRVGCAEGMELIARVLWVVGVEKWEALPGKYVRVRHDWSKVHAIGNVIEDKWLDFEEFWKNPFVTKEEMR